MAAAFLLVCAASAGAEPYVTLRGGTQWWGDTSNADGLESGTEPGQRVELAVGDEAGLSDLGLPKSDFALDLEAVVAQQWESLHGRNHGENHQSADGKTLEVTTFGANLWPGWQATRQLTLYTGGGGGVGLARAFGHSNWEPWWQVGAGARWNLTPALSLEVGERTLWLDGVKLRGYRATYEAVHSLLAGVRWEFK